MSKAHDPHWRYIAFKIEGAPRLSRRAVQNAITGRARHDGFEQDALPQLTRFEHPHGIVRVAHLDVPRARTTLTAITWAIEAAARIEFTLTTLGTSGTIKSLTSRHRILQKRGEPAPQSKPRRPKPGKPRSSQY